MLSTEDNERFTRVGRGTAMGELLRRYWHPIAAASEFESAPVRRVRLLGEDLTLYKDRRGTYGLIQRHCPHRRADLSFGYVDDGGLRCNYHGWQFDAGGRCINQPYEDTVAPETGFKDKIQVLSYPVEEKAGLIFAYLGPAPAPLVPQWEPFTYKNVFAQIVFFELECNWLQAQENSVDPVHFEWLHANWSAAQKGLPQDAPSHRRLGFDEWDFGFQYRRVMDNTDENDRLWKIGRLALLPNIFVPRHFEYRVPIDDERTLAVLWVWDRVPNEQVPYVQERIPAWWAPKKDPATGELLARRIVNQDSIAVTSQGKIFDRSQEHLGRSDRGITMLRNQLRRDMNAVARGEDPKGQVWDLADNECIEWPDSERKIIDAGMSKEEWLAANARFYTPETDDYFFLAEGQPEQVRIDFKEAMGLT